ncbi:MAG TPA: NAD-dependent epimerase/dehydratase family protein [Burkholderiales bacterium]|nr:NAD-dependent epimerase/dehydratase family protein [Burkholderiales bacterium]
MKLNRVFVSGGAGVIGLEIVPRLVARGAAVLVGDLKPRPAAFGSEIVYRQGDLNHMTPGELEDFAPDAFIHLAATFERSVETYGFWAENFRHNVQLSHQLMSIARDIASLRRVVFASSYLIYDPSLYQFDAPRETPRPLVETDPVSPRNLTGMAKFAHEMELRFLNGFCADRFSSVCARIFRGYGRNSRDVISRWVRSLLKDETITVYRPEGMFDYVYAADAAEGLVRLAEAADVTGIVNLGTGRSRRVQDVLDTLGRHFPGMRTELHESDLAFEASQADVSLLQAGIGWRPEYDLDTAIPEIIEHERVAASERRSAPVPLAVLVTSASRKTPLLYAVREAARRIGTDAKVIAGDANPQALCAYVADEFWCMPPTNPQHIAEVLDGCRARDISVILPTRDGELSFWAENSTAFEAAGISIVVSPAASLRLCLDKLAFAQHGRTLGLPFIPAALDIDEIDAVRYVVKERYGAGSRALGLDLDRAAALAHARTLEAPIFQPFVTGREISIDAWLDRSHRVKGLVLRRRDLVVGGESQVTTTFRDAAVEARAAAILDTLRLRGPVVMQAFVDAAGAVHVIECNPRFGGASTTAIAAGLDTLYWSVLEARGGDVGGCRFRRIDGEVRQIRVAQDSYSYGRDF